MNIKELIQQSNLLVMSVKAWTILFLTFATTMALAEVPDSLNVQGRATTPLTTISGTATILPAGVSQPFTASTDENGVFQFSLTGITASAFSDPSTSLRLEIGTTTISIPFTSVPFAFRADVADTLVSGATMQVNILSVSSMTAMTINVTTITVTNIFASGATVDGSISVGGGIKIGKTIYIGGIAEPGAENTIKFEGGGGTIATIAPGPGPLTLQTQGGFPINLNPGGPGLVSIGGNLELRSNQRLIQAIGGPLRIQLAPGDIYMAEGNGSVGVGVLAPAVPVSRLHVVANDPILEVSNVLTLDHTTTGAPASGIGAGLLMRAENAANVLENAAQISGILTTVMDGSEEGALAFLTRNGAGLTEKVRINSVGNVGIGTIAPATRLDVEGNAQFGSGATKSIFTTTGDLLIPGRIGIGTTSPGAELHVVGSIKMVDGTQGADKILTSNAGGLATWQYPAAAATDTDWTIVGNNIYRLNGNVGIGTTGPAAKLDVAGDIKLSGSLIGAGVVGTTALASSAVTTDKLASSAVTAGKLASSAVTAGKLATSAVTRDKLKLSWGSWTIKIYAQHTAAAFLSPHSHFPSQSASKTYIHTWNKWSLSSTSNYVVSARNSYTFGHAYWRGSYSYHAASDQIVVVAYNTEGTLLGVHVTEKGDENSIKISDKDGNEIPLVYEIKTVERDSELFDENGQCKYSASEVLKMLEKE